MPNYQEFIANRYLPYSNDLLPRQLEATSRQVVSELINFLEDSEKFPNPKINELIRFVKTVTKGQPIIAPDERKEFSLAFTATPFGKQVSLVYPRNFIDQAYDNHAGLITSLIGQASKARDYATGRMTEDHEIDPFIEDRAMFFMGEALYTLLDMAADAKLTPEQHQKFMGQVMPFEYLLNYADATPDYKNYPTPNLSFLKKDIKTRSSESHTKFLESMDRIEASPLGFSTIAKSVRLKTNPIIQDPIRINFQFEDAFLRHLTNFAVIQGVPFIIIDARQYFMVSQEEFDADVVKTVAVADQFPFGFLLRQRDIWAMAASDQQAWLEKTQSGRITLDPREMDIEEWIKANLGEPRYYSDFGYIDLIEELKNLGYTKKIDLFEFIRKREEHVLTVYKQNKKVFESPEYRILKPVERARKFASHFAPYFVSIQP